MSDCQSEEVHATSYPEVILQQHEEGNIHEGVVEITLYALLGSLLLGIMRVWGRINQQEMVILIDSGSTHSFIDIALWKEL